MNQDDRDFIINAVNRLLKVPYAALTNAEIVKLKGLLRKL
jgi:hypothetical protein|tara:strand:+ start:250 stop:369 length:120 start_codon:yes stop_codon:yes gene_type:complete